MNFKIYDITPVPKPRMTQSVKWKRKPGVVRYFQFKDQVRELNIELPECGYHVIFIMPMADSWPKKKKEKMRHKPHQQTPDKDNLEKALLDALFTNDAHIWDGRVSKIWGDVGQIIIIEEESFMFPLPDRGLFIHGSIMSDNRDDSPGLHSLQKRISEKLIKIGFGDVINKIIIGG